MDVQVNFWAVLLAAVSSMVIGTVYYADSVFGRTWKAEARLDEKRINKEFPKKAPWLFIAALLTAYIVAHVMFLAHSFFGGSWIGSGVTTALWLWLGLSATSLFVHNLLEQKPARLTWIAVGNRLLSILTMGLILGWLHT